MNSDLDRIPPPYPGELWYSVVARGIRDWGYCQRAARVRFLTGALSPRLNVAFPIRPNSIIPKIRFERFPRPRTFANLHTLLPYYLAFDSPSRQREISTTVDRGDRPLTRVVGALRSPLTPRFLRFCPDCMERDRRSFRECYWHRAHQLPGALRCYRHMTWLLDSIVPYALKGDEYWTAHPSRCINTAAAVPERPATRRLTESLSRCSTFLLVTPSHSQHMTRPEYAELIRQCGLVQADGRIASKRLGEELQAFLTRHGAQVGSFGSRFWWRLAYTQVQGRLWPVQHVLLRLFLSNRFAETGHESTSDLKRVNAIGELQ